MERSYLESRAEGTVETGSGSMLTAFSATWSNGKGPTLMAYAEYVETPRGREGWIPATMEDSALVRSVPKSS